MKELKTPVTITVLLIIIGCLVWSKQKQKDVLPPSNVIATVQNGGFEEQRVWESFVSGKDLKIHIDQSEKVAHTGKHSAILENHEAKKAEVYGCLYQRINCKPNTAYVISCWFKCKDAAKKGVLSGQVFLSADAKWDQRDYLPITQEVMDWTFHSFRATSLNVDHFTLVIVSENIATVWIDDVSIQEVK